MSLPDRAGGAAAAKRNPILASAMMIFGGIIWGATFSLAKLVTEAGVHPFGLALDRKSVVSGKGVDLGGRRIIKKKKHRTEEICTESHCNAQTST